ncbi:hypothetical protein TrLO_g6596 [Triparma laevis f. longispina]|nr:hypothetical protein TrLO_g6596 [Triparma laevis f. longispina]
MPKVLAKYPVLTKIPLQWGEMDAFSHLNNVIYFRYFESIRLSHFYRLSDHLDPEFFHGFMHAKSLGPILASTSCKYKFPATYPDTIIAASGIHDVPEVGDSRFTMNYALYSTRHDRLIAEGDGVIVMYDYGVNKKGEVTAEIKEAIERVKDDQRFS